MPQGTSLGRGRTNRGAAEPGPQAWPQLCAAPWWAGSYPAVSGTGTQGLMAQLPNSNTRGEKGPLNIMPEQRRSHLEDDRPLSEGTREVSTQDAVHKSVPAQQNGASGFLLTTSREISSLHLVCARRPPAEGLRRAAARRMGARPRDLNES